MPLFISSNSFRHSCASPLPNWCNWEYPVPLKVTLNVDQIRREIIHERQAQEIILENNFFHHQHSSLQLPSQIHPFSSNASIISRYPIDLILEFLFPPVPSCYNFTYHLKALHNSVKINLASETAIHQFYAFQSLLIWFFKMQLYQIAFLSLYMI